MPLVKGGCFCGAIRYRVNAPLAGAAACHCRKCQYGSGGGPNYVVLAPRVAFEVTSGHPVAHASRADSGAEVVRTFCGTCGTPLWSDSPNLPFVAIRAGSLDDPSPAKPAAVPLPANVVTDPVVTLRKRIRLVPVSAM